jgi:Domain of unknown function (DUF1707)
MRYRWDPVYVATGRRTSPATDTHLRASDAERNEVADKLSRHFAEGRLDSAEFKERLDRAMGATTRGDLNGLFDDLPRLVEEPPAPPSHPRRHRLVPFLFVVAVVAVVAGSTAWSMHLPWLLFVLAALFLWNRSSRFHHHRQNSPGGSDHQVIG